MSPSQYYNTGNGLSPTLEYAVLLEARVQALKAELEEVNRVMSIAAGEEGLVIRVDENGCVRLSSKDIEAIARKVIELLKKQNSISYKGGT